MKIVTLTLNPAFDLHCNADTFFAKHENFASITSFEAGGKGINVSRALLSGGTENTAIAVLGSENAPEFERTLSKDGINLKPFYTKGRIRENITVHAADGETRLSFDGASVDAKILDGIKSEILSQLDSGDFLVFSGSLAKGITVSDAVNFLREISAAGIKIAVDCRSFGIDDMKAAKPFLIKPNEEEIAHCLKKEQASEDEMLAAARELHQSGIENVMISLGAKGALLVCDDGEFHADTPKCDVISTIGAGDSSIAGFVAAASRGENVADCLKTSMAYGNCACKTEGTRPPKPEDIKSVLGKIEVTKI